MSVLPLGPARIERTVKLSRLAPGRDAAGFAALAVLGALRWNTLLSPGASGRLLALAALASAVWLAGGLLPRAALVAVAVVALAAVPVLSGWPASWILHLRLAVLWRSIWAGLAFLPSALVPYRGLTPEVRQAIVLCGGLLMLAASVSAAVTRRPSAARPLAAIFLLALAVIPVTVVRPGVPDAEGLLLLALLVGFVAGPRIGSGAGLSALMAVLLAGIAAIPLAHAIRPAHPWITPSSLTGGDQTGQAARFDWRQTYGRLRWPREGRLVLSIAARRPLLWKAENLDGFDGRGWTLAALPRTAEPLASWARQRFTETITVTDDGIDSSQIIAGGSAEAPVGVSGVVPGPSPGTWLRTGALSPGEGYRVRVYSPDPSAAELAAPTREPAGMQAYRALPLPTQGGVGGGGLIVNVTFGAFHRHQPAAVAAGLDQRGTAQAIAGSPYAPVYGEAQRLSAGAERPIEVIDNVLRFLSSGRYRYAEDPVASPYPLVEFLLGDRRGYCQHFAGAMALLLRMDGIPARVATGFTRGTLDSATGEWDVEDIEAHAWVEAWLPGLGWVSFDPTPSVAPELAAVGAPTAPVHPVRTPGGRHGLGEAAGPSGSRPAPGRRAATSRRPGGSEPLWWLLVPTALLLAPLARVLRWRDPTPEALVAELERALARCRRPLPTGSTLARLEARMREDPEAAAYVRKLRSARYAPGGRSAPTRRERAALRRALRRGAGWSGYPRALWSLPPLVVLVH